jgi:hypothetical protein
MPPIQNSTSNAGLRVLSNKFRRITNLAELLGPETKLQNFEIQGSRATIRIST